MCYKWLVSEKQIINNLGRTDEPKQKQVYTQGDAMGSCEIAQANLLITHLNESM